MNNSVPSIPEQIWQFIKGYNITLNRITFEFNLTISIASMAEPIFIDEKGIQKGFSFLYETLSASNVSEKTC